MKSLLERDATYVWHPFTQVQTEGTPLPIVKAKDSLLFDEEGKSYIDCNSSWWVNVHGHGRPEIQQAINQQFQALDHVVFAGITHPKAVELAEHIIDLLPSSFSKVFFSDNGSTAIEVALKMSMQYWYNKGIAKKRMLAIEGAYHGDTFGAMSVGERDQFNRPFESFFFDADYLPFPSPENEKIALDKAKELFATGEFAAVIVEPLVQGSAGMRMYSSEWLDELIKLAQANDVFVIFDEVMTGWGRTGKLFALDHCQEVPDFVCLSKGLTGGTLPLGLTVTKQAIFEAFLDDEKARGFLHGHSYTGNPLACAAACATIEIFKNEASQLDIERIRNEHRIFYERIKGHPMLNDVRQCGTIIALELSSDNSSNYFSSIRERAFQFFIDKGMFLRPLGNVIFLNPPYCTTNEQLHYCYEVMEEFLALISKK